MRTRRGTIDQQQVTTKTAIGRIYLCFLFLLGYCWVCSASTSSSGYDSVPWQPASDHTAIDEAARYEDFPVSVFSPTGRLFPVEAAVKASQQRTPLSNLVIACQCQNGLVVVAIHPISVHVDARSSNSTKEDSLVVVDDETMGPVFDLHPCIVGATAGNAVDNQILRGKLLGLTSLDHDDDEVSSGRLAKDLANQLQVVTQDIGASQKQKLGRLLASSALILGNRRIWRIDPTGQFWDCHAAIVGENADRTEELLYKRLLQECQTRNSTSPQQLLESLSSQEALELIRDFLETNLAKQQQRQEEEPKWQNDSKKSSEEKSTTATTTSEDKESNLSSPVYWQGMILDYASQTRNGAPQRTWKRGVFGVRQTSQA